MAELQYSIDIDAPASTVWRTVIEPDTYRVWTKPFNGDSRFEGTWELGEKIRFLGTDDDGKQMGMHAQIVECRPYEIISIRHLGEIVDGVEKDGFSGDPALSGGHETYRFVEAGERTTMQVTMDAPDEWVEMFDQMWPPALEALKSLAEGN